MYIYIHLAVVTILHMCLRSESVHFPLFVSPAGVHIDRMLDLLVNTRFEQKCNR